MNEQTNSEKNKEIKVEIKKINLGRVIHTREGRDTEGDGHRSIELDFNGFFFLLRPTGIAYHLPQGPTLLNPFCFLEYFPIKSIFDYSVVPSFLLFFCFCSRQRNFWMNDVTIELSKLRKEANRNQTKFYMVTRRVKWRTSAYSGNDCVHKTRSGQTMRHIWPMRFFIARELH